MFLQSGLKEFNSRTRSISPLPASAIIYNNHDITDLDQLGGHGRSRPFLAVGDTGSSESPTTYSFSDEGCSSGDFSVVNLAFFYFKKNIDYIY